MTSIFHNERDPGPDLTVPRRAGTIGAILGFCLNFGIEFVTISNSRSSTAAIGFIFLPFFSALVSIPAFGIGWCLGYFLTWRRSRIKERKVSAFAAGLVPLLVAVWIIKTLWGGNDLTQQVHRVQTMNAADLEGVLNQPRLARNKFILGAIAENPKATASVLHRIVRSDLPELHEPMGSHFDVMGSNTHGLAVMRLVARNTYTAPGDLERLADSKNEYVLGDVAANPKLSEGTLRRLAKKGGYLVEWGLGLNSHTPKDILARLAMSADEFTRAHVAANPNAPAEVLSGLSVDHVWHVRASVARNPATPRSIVELLLQDADTRVRGEAKANTGVLPAR
jgi:Leucine rich repeat variant